MGIFGKLFGGTKKVDIEARFERLRSAVSGTMSNFFVAKDREHGDRIVGVKLCDIEKVEFFESRFKGMRKPSEGQIAIKMHHPHVVETYEFGLTTKNQPYLVMEFIDGPGMQQLINNREEALLGGRRLELIRQMAEALAYVHRSGFIHRDICPRNYICLEDMSNVKLIDFGLTLPAEKDFMQPGNRTGTPLYMSPEVIRRRATDHRVDIFSFGVTCYHLLTFEFPWPVIDASGMAALQHDTSPPTDIFKYRPKLNPQLAQAVLQAMHPNVQLRTPDMDSFLKVVRGLKSEEVQ
jgi:serine/threonine-protein kinase